MKKIIFIIFIANIHSMCWGQNPAPTATNSANFRPNYILPSVEVGSLLQNTSYNLSAATGVLPISIPLYEIKAGGITVPISLNYDASGIKVEQQASIVGLGWTLTAGGAIKKMIMDKDDDDPSSSIYQNSLGTDWNTAGAPDPNASEAEYNTCDGIVNGTIDGCPDWFSYTAPGINGGFIRNNGTYMNIPASNTIISTQEGNWVLVSGDGNKYTFDEGDLESNSNRFLNYTTAGSSNGVKNYNTAWNLSKITGYDLSDEVQFQYDESTYEYMSGRFFSRKYKCQQFGGFNYYSPNYSSTSKSLHFIHSKILTKIIWSDGSVEFIYAQGVAARKDLAVSGTTPAKLTSMVVKDKLGNTIKQIDFHYDYFVVENKTITDATADECRLKLVELVSYDDMGDPKPYKFNYNEAVFVCPKSSLAQDYDGYYNGATLNNTLIPQKAYLQFIDVPDNPFNNCAPGSPVTVQGADRNTNPDKAQMAVLKTINYPTGGTTNFEYGSNEIYNESQESIPIFDIYQVEALKWSTPSSGFDGSVQHSHNGQGIPSTPVTVQNDGYIFDVYEDITIPNNSETVNGVNARIQCSMVNEGAIQPHPYAKVFLYGPAGTSNPAYYRQLNSIAYDNQHDCEELTLMPGNYILSAGTNGKGWSAHANLRIMSSVVTVPANTNVPVGGLRIESVTTTDPFTGNEITDKYDYSIPDGDGKSSLYGPAIPYASEFTTQSMDFETPTTTTAPQCMGPSQTDPFPIPISCCYYQPATVTLASAPRNSHNIGPVLFYEYITKRRASGAGIGKTVTKYNKELNTFRFWRNNEAINVTQYDEANNKVSESTMTMVTATEHAGYVTGYDIIYLYKHPCSISHDTYTFHVLPIPLIYRTEWRQLQAKTDIVYQGGTPFSKSYLYSYDPGSLNISGVMRINSDYSILVDNYKYSSSYSFPASTTLADNVMGIKLLFEGNNVNRITEQYSQLKLAGASSFKTTDATLYEFTHKEVGPFGNYSHIGVLSGIDRLELTDPLSNFSPASVTVSGMLSKDSRYANRFLVKEYTSAMQPSHVTDDGKDQALLYMYGGRYLVAKAVNAKPGHVAYSSFECPNETGFWNYSEANIVNDKGVTGQKAYHLISGQNISIILGDLPQDFVVSYWTDGDEQAIKVNGSGPDVIGLTTVSGWTYHEHHIQVQSNIPITNNVTPPSVSISGIGHVDELRLYPVYAQMETATYNPLKGIQSRCDVANKIEHYRYNTIGQFSGIEDINGNAIEKHTYNVLKSDQ